MSSKERRESLKKIFVAGLKAVAPDEALKRHLSLNGTTLVIDGQNFDLSQGKIRVAGAGKGVAPMAQALESILGDLIQEGVVVTKYGHTLPLKNFRQREAAHPVPDDAGKNGADEILELASRNKPEDIFIVLITGGASALLPAPVEGITLEDLKHTTALLLASGAEIGEINAIRKHLSRISGGRLAQAANGATTISIIVSDVIGDELSVIASGPTVGDISTFNDCLKIIDKYQLADKLPVSVEKYLENGALGLFPETPKPKDRIFAKNFISLTATNAQALDAAAHEAEKLGFKTKSIAKPLQGEAVIAAKQLVKEALEIQKKLKLDDKPVCLLAGGETTVTIKGTGKGGRNQEMALACAIELANSSEICALFAGTDGTDGPTDAAGGFAFPDSVEKMGGVKKAVQYLENNDSNLALKQADDLLITGPTRTNVMDLAILLIFSIK